MKFSMVTGLVLATMLALTGAGLSSPVAAQQATAVPASAPAALDYKLGVADHLRILVFNEPSLSGEFDVNANGSVSLPLIGDIPAAGRTTSELNDTITQKLADGYLRDPKVSIDVLTFRPYYILGEVNKPGQYTYSTGLTVLNAVATAQGFTYRADKRRVYVKHEGQTSETSLKLEDGLSVSPGDTIRIGERYF